MQQKQLLVGCSTAPLGRAPTNAQPTSNFIKADAQLNQQHNDTPAMSPEDRRAVKIMNDTVHVCLKDGHYEMSLPWRQYPPKLPNNKQQALNRLNHLKKRLENDPTLHQKYNQFMEELFQNNHARRVTSQNW